MSIILDFNYREDILMLELVSVKKKITKLACNLIFIINERDIQ